MIQYWFLGAHWGEIISLSNLVGDMPKEGGGGAHSLLE